MSQDATPKRGTPRRIGSGEISEIEAGPLSQILVERKPKPWQDKGRPHPQAADLPEVAKPDMEAGRAFPAMVRRWVDGDTVDLLVDMGFYIFGEQRIRLLGIDTPERGQEGYDEATEFMRERAPEGSSITLLTYKGQGQDKYGRWLGVIWNGTEMLNQSVVEAGLAKSYDGGKKS